MKKILITIYITTMLFIGVFCTNAAVKWETIDGKIYCTITYKNDKVSQMNIIGTFTENWKEPGWPMKKNNKGLWEITFEMLRVKEYYNFFNPNATKGDAYLKDPEAMDFASNPFGSQNCILRRPKKEDLALENSTYVVRNESEVTNVEYVKSQDSNRKSVDVNNVAIKKIGEFGGYLASSFKSTGDYQFIYSKLNTPQGHGFAAERANNMIDRLHGLDAHVVGDNFLKNGPDRKIIGRNGKELIQTKYCKTAYESVNAAFENGKYRYYDPASEIKDPMQLEVPKDQYDDALRYMEKYIREGKVDGMKNPNDASKIVRKGNVTYKQAVNIAKAGTVESLTYDFATGAVSAGIGFGISFAFDYAFSRMNGSDRTTSLFNASKNGLFTGGLVWGTHIIVSQLSRVVFKKQIEQQLAIQFGRQMANEFIQASSKVIFQKVMFSTIVGGVIFTLGLTARDAWWLFRGKITFEEFLTCLKVNIISLAAVSSATIAGTYIGTMINPGAGTAIGAASGFVAGLTTSLVVGILEKKKVKQQAEEMYAIVNDEISVLSEDYLITQKELDLICEKIKIDVNFVKDMYKSTDRYKYAQNYLEPYFVSALRNRPHISMPTEKEAREEYRKMMKGIALVY